MKKIVALLLAVLMTLVAVSALAETVTIGDTRLSIDLGELEVYELMDESTIQQDDAHWNGEAHFGIVNTGADGKPGPVKEAYRTLQTMLCGGKAEYRTVYTPVE